MRKFSGFVFLVGMVLQALYAVSFGVELGTDNQYSTPGTWRATPGQAAVVASEVRTSSGQDLQSVLDAGGAGGTEVIANPTGTDGDALNRIRIAGENYNVAGTGGGPAVDQTARDAAASAQSTADSANTAAAAAQTTANSAQSTANSASTAAATAQSTANSASSTATAARSAATAAGQAAATAQTAADNAQSSANAAARVANTADGLARQAGTAAQTAQTTADTANTTALGAETVANSATLLAQAAQSTADSKTTVTANPAGADGVALNRIRIGTANFNLPTGGGGGGVDQIARDAATAAQSTADTALSTANTAVGAASAAQASADAARLVADAATTPAQAAQAVRDGVEDWAETGSTLAIPENKIPNTIARDTELPVVPARAGAFTAADEAKLDGIQPGAQVNAPDEFVSDAYFNNDATTLFLEREEGNDIEVPVPASLRAAPPTQSSEDIARGLETLEGQERLHHNALVGAPETTITTETVLRSIAVTRRDPSSGIFNPSITGATYSDRTSVTALSPFAQLTESYVVLRRTKADAASNHNDTFFVERADREYLFNNRVAQDSNFDYYATEIASIDQGESLTVKRRTVTLENQVRAFVQDWAEQGNADVIPAAKLGTGTADETTVLYGDGTFKLAPTGGGGMPGGVELIHEVGTAYNERVTTDITYTLPDGKRFSDYDVLYFVVDFGLSDDSSGLCVVPESNFRFWIASRTLGCYLGFNYLRLYYISDTSFRFPGLGTSGYRKLYGLKAGSGGGSDPSPGLPATDQYVHLGEHNLGSTTNSGQVAPTTVSVTTGTVSSFTIQYDDSLTQTNLPTGATYTQSTGALVLPEGHWSVSVGVRITEPGGPTGATARVGARLQVMYGDAIWFATSSYLRNATSIDETEGYMTLTGNVNTDGTTTIVPELILEAQSNRTVTVNVSHLHGYRVDSTGGGGSDDTTGGTSEWTEIYTGNAATSGGGGLTSGQTFSAYTELLFLMGDSRLTTSYCSTTVPVAFWTSADSSFHASCTLGDGTNQYSPRVRRFNDNTFISLLSNDRVRKIYGR